MKILSIIILFTIGAQAKEISICTSETTYQFLFAEKISAFEKKTGHQLKFIGDLKTNSSDICLKHLLEKKSDFATSIGAWEELVDIAKKNGIKESEINSIAHRNVGRDLLHVVTHLSIPIKKFKIEQLEKMLDGRTTNWKDVGGPDLPITFVAGFNTGNAFLKKVVLKGKEFTKNTIDGKSVPGLMDLVKKTPGSFGIISKARHDEGVNEADIEANPPIGRRILALTIGKPNPEIESVLSYFRK